MWPFKRNTEPAKDIISLRLAGFSSDIFVLYGRLNKLESKIATLDKRVAELEKILKTCNIHVTIV